MSLWRHRSQTLEMLVLNLVSMFRGHLVPKSTSYSGSFWKFQGGGVVTTPLGGSCYHKILGGTRVKLRMLDSLKWLFNCFYHTQHTSILRQAHKVKICIYVSWCFQPTTSTKAWDTWGIAWVVLSTINQEACSTETFCCPFNLKCSLYEKTCKRQKHYHVDQ